MRLRVLLSRAVGYVSLIAFVLLLLLIGVAMVALVER